MNSRGPAISLAVLLTAAFLLSVLNAGVASGSSTSPISISGDSDLAAQAASNGWSGDGSSSNPYVISGVVIDGPANGLGIFVSGTTKHLVIEDCSISNTTSYAIDITGASNVTIRDNALDGCFCAILVYSSDHSTITNNSVSACKTGIQLMSSDHVVVSYNSIADTEYNGIELITASNNTITSNTVIGSGGYAIELSGSDDNLIYGNTFTDNNGAGAEYSTGHAQAYDLGTNTWSYGGQGNAWSDWSSTDPYPYEGSAAADAILNSFSIEDALPIIAIAVVAVIAIAVIVLAVKRSGAKAKRNAAQQPPARYDQPMSTTPAQAPSPRPSPKIKPWVPAVAAVVVVIVAVLVVTASMGLLPIGSGKLSGARNISGEWEGTGTFWNYNIFGEKGMLIEANFHMKITLNGNHVTGVLDIYPTSQTKITDDIAVQEPENHLSIDGNYEVTTLTFEAYDTAFEFDFLTDLATGQMTNTDDNYYLGLGSDHGAIHLQRV